MVQISLFHLMPYAHLDAAPRTWPVPHRLLDPTQAHDDYGRYLDQMALADELGWDWVGCNEHHYTPYGLMSNPTLIGAALTQRTRRCRIAMLGSLIALNNPVRIAEEYAMLDVMSGGRLIAGLIRGTPNEYIAYGVDPRLARALAWMESGFQEDVVSSAGAVGAMQLLPETWQWVDTVLLGERTPRTYEGNVRAGVRYLRWQLDQFGGDVRLALAGYYQGARAVRERGLFDDTKQYVSVIQSLYGSV